MNNRFELFVAGRYLRAKRKQAVISVITVISVIGVAAGVMALIIALGVTNGFRGTLERNLLGATAHVSILEKTPGSGIEHWRELQKKLAALPGVTNAAPALYGYVFFTGPSQGDGGVLKGLDLEMEKRRGEVAANIKQGSLDALAKPGTVILGSKLAMRTGMMLGSIVQVISPQGEMTPLGPRPSYYKMRVVGIFESGFYDLDAKWAFTSMASVQKVFSLDDVVNSIELKVNDLDRAPEIAHAAEAIIGPELAATPWQEQNKQLLGALKMDRVVTLITISLIQLVGGLNILISLVMMVMEKHRDIAILVSMGAKKEQIRRIFVMQGVMIGAAGTAIGLALGYTLSFLANHYRWIRLDEELYSLSFVPFEPRWHDAIWVTAAALLVSYVATIYPSRNAAKIDPVESLRYE
jgi:lipoprotein-releasing system permease protein